MIPQILMDWFRDVVLNFLNLMDSMLGGIDFEGAAGAIGGVSQQASHVLALFISPGVWPAIATAWAAWLAIWGITGLVAIVARRGTSS